jgi:ankyrin repeat protein
MTRQRSQKLVEFLERLKEEDGLFADATFEDLSEVGSEDNALHAAVWRAEVEIARELIELGVDVNCQGDMLQTPLHIAIGKCNYEMIDMLLDNGASLFVSDQLHCQPPYFLAVLRNNQDLLQQLATKLFGKVKGGGKRRILESWIRFHETNRDRLQEELDQLSETDDPNPQ